MVGGRGYPISGLGGTLSRSGWWGGTLSQVWGKGGTPARSGLGYPIPGGTRGTLPPGLDGGYPS